MACSSASFPLIIYLAGPINGCSDSEANDWREEIIAAYPQHEFLNPMRRDYRGIEDSNVDDIVHGDLEDIRTCDVFLANCPQPSWGTAMEIREAYTQGKDVVIVVPEGLRISPWLRYHANEILTSLKEVEL